MKKVVIVLLVLIGLNAQNLSVYGGLNIAAGVDNSVPTGKKDKNSAYGFGYDIDLPVISLHAGINFTKSSFFGELRGTENLLNVGELSFKQLEVPVMIKMHIFPWVVKPYIFGGVIYQKVMSVDFKDISVPDGETYDGEDFVKKSFTPLVFGIGIDIDLPVLPTMFTEVRVITAKDYDIDSEYGSFNQLQVLLGLRF